MPYGHILAIALFVAIATPALAAGDEAPPPPNQADSNALPESGAPLAKMMPLPADARITYRITLPDGSQQTRTWTVQPEVTYGGRRVIPLESEDETRFLDAGTRNWVATLRNGKVIAMVDPNDGTWSWPLKLGKQWHAEFTYHEPPHNFSVGPIATDWRVEGWERVTVPAGTFRAYRVHGEPGRNNTRRLTLWYAPEIALTVRREQTQATGVGSQRAITVWELVSYRR